jgi:hypothetical protein
MSLLLGYIGSILGYMIPLSLIYHFVYNRSGGLFRMFILFLLTYLIGSIACMLYYRMGIMGQSGGIGSLTNTQVLTIMTTTLIAYMVVALTIIAIGLNRGMVEIFENTLGYGYIQLFGSTAFANKIFSSKQFDNVKDNMNDGSFNYGFLLTIFNTRNINEFVEALTSSPEGSDNSKLPFDFQLKADKDQIEKLEDYIYTKHRIGHFSWVYFTSIIAMTISMIAMGMPQT